MSAAVSGESGPKRALRLLVLLEQAEPTGLVRQLVELLARLVPSRVRVHLACIVREGVDTKALEALVLETGHEFSVVRERRILDPVPLRDVRRLADRWKADLVEAHGYKSAAYAFLLKPWMSASWIAVYHGRTTTDWKVRAYHRLEQWLVGQADAVVAVAPGVESHFRPADRERLKVIPNGIVPLPAPFRSRQVVREDLSFSDEDVVVGFVGRLSHEKGPDLFLEALSELRRRDQAYRGLVVGDGPLRRSLQQTLTESDGVRFVGRAKDVAELYGAMDVLAIPSRSEVFPNVLLEGVEALLPVAATPVGGIPWIAHDLATVSLADAAEPAAIADAVLEAHAGHSKASLRRSRDILRQVYSQESRARTALALYDGLRGPRR